MLTYQVKIKVDASIEKAWLHWMKTTHVPDMIATGLIRSFQVLKSQQACTYLFHYHFESKRDFDDYYKNYAPTLKKHPAQKFPNQFEAERELLEWI